MTELILREMVFRTGQEDPIVVRDRRPPHGVDITNLRSFVVQSYGDPLEPAWSGKREATVQVGWTTSVPPNMLSELGLLPDDDVEMVVMPMAPDSDTGELVSILFRLAEQRELFERLSREEGVAMTTGHTGGSTLEPGGGG